jgi:hypothetical protein
MARIIYVGRRRCESLGEAALEASRLSGEDVGVWQISRALLWNKGSVNGIPVFERKTPEGGAAEEGKQRGRAPLVRMHDWYGGGIPPRWR